MKKFLLLLLLILSISCQHIENKQSAPKKDTIVSAPKIVFVVIGKGIDFDKMEILKKGAINPLIDLALFG